MGLFIFYLHYVLLTSGTCGVSVLLGVVLKTYSNASQTEIGLLLTSFPFVAIVVKPLFCSLADRYSAHKFFLIGSLLSMLIGFAPFITVPFYESFYKDSPRLAWWVFVLGCQLGSGALGVSWSLGDSLAVNAAQRTKTPYARMRLMGTISWGVYGYIIGQINETPMLPKFVPAFLILYLSVMIEIVFLLFWNDDDFKMYDCSDDKEPPAGPEEISQELKRAELQLAGSSTVASSQLSLNRLPDNVANQFRLLNESDPTGLVSASGSLRLNKAAGLALRDLIANDDLGRKLRSLSQSGAGDDESLNAESHQTQMQQQQVFSTTDQVKPVSATLATDLKRNSISKLHELSSHADLELDQQQESASKIKSIQLTLFRLIMSEDMRLIKYLVLFTLYGFLMTPLNFLFISMEEECKKTDCNYFSNLAGSVLISQAAMETVSFFVMPYFTRRISRPWLILVGFLVLASRSYFYSNFYYTTGLSPYWALISEWGHGLAYAIFATILADLAFMFANESELFIPQLRKLGLLTDEKVASLEKVLAEEMAIKMALRATMQAVFSGAMDGLGQGIGNLVCGLIYDYFGHIRLWQVATAIAILSLLLQQLAELTKTRFSDAYQSKALSVERHDCSQLEIRCDTKKPLQTIPEMERLEEN